MTIKTETKGGPSPTPRYFVHIVESPSPGDLLNGRAEGRLLTEALSLAGIISVYNLAANYASFLEALSSRLGETMNEINGIPILHFSTHGNADGIELTDHTFITWAELRDLLVPINTVLNGGLVLCMSSCSGYNACRMAMQADAESPFFGMVGHTGTPPWSDAAVAFVTFYHRFFKGSPVPDAVKAMAIAAGDNGFREILGTQARQIWVDYIEQERQKEIEERVKTYLEELRTSDQRRE